MCLISSLFTCPIVLTFNKLTHTKELFSYVNESQLTNIQHFPRFLGQSIDRYAKDFRFPLSTPSHYSLTFPGCCLALCTHFSGKVSEKMGENHKLNIYPNKENSASRISARSAHKESKT